MCAFAIASTRLVCSGKLWCCNSFSQASTLDNLAAARLVRSGSAVKSRDSGKVGCSGAGWIAVAGTSAVLASCTSRDSEEARR